MAAPRIFISYRRDDSAGFARAIGDALGQRFGRESIWLDVDDIGAGEAFDAEIERAVGAAAVLLVLIGRRWLGVQGDGRRRIDEPDDFVRHEVATGLARGMQVIPLLLDGAAMPAEADLPDALRPLARRQAVPIDNARFNADLDHLEAVLRATLKRRAEVGRPLRRRLALGAGTVVVAGLALWGWRYSQARPAINGNWVAEVSYDWPNAHYVERFAFGGDGRVLHGKAGFLGSYRGIVDGSVEPDGHVFFVVRTQERMGNDEPRTTTHRYRGRLAGDTIRFVMHTDGGSTEHVPVEFTARRASP